jgi:hypothetical protein
MGETDLDNTAIPSLKAIVLARDILARERRMRAG